MVINGDYTHWLEAFSSFSLESSNSYFISGSWQQFDTNSIVMLTFLEGMLAPVPNLHNVFEIPPKKKYIYI